MDSNSAMSDLHLALGLLTLAANAAAAVWGVVTLLRRRPSPTFLPVARAAQGITFVQLLLGVLLLTGAGAHPPRGAHLLAALGVASVMVVAQVLSSVPARRASPSGGVMEPAVAREPAAPGSARAAGSPPEGAAATLPETAILGAGFVLVSALAVLAVMTGWGALSSRGEDGGRNGGGLDLVVTRPNRGPAPPVTLGHLALSGRGPGVMYDLGRDRGRRILLYFRDGVECDACWNQQRALERPGAVQRVGVDRVVSIIRDPLRPARDEAVRHGARPPLSDPGGSTFARYGLPLLGRPGHSFVLVGRTGRIERRADFVSDIGFPRTVAVPDLARALRR